MGESFAFWAGDVAGDDADDVAGDVAGDDADDVAGDYANDVAGVFMRSINSPQIYQILQIPLIYLRPWIYQIYRIPQIPLIYLRLMNVWHDGLFNRNRRFV